MTEREQNPLGLHFDRQDHLMGQNIIGRKLSPSPQTATEPNWHDLGALLDENPDLRLQSNEDIYQIIASTAKDNLAIYQLIFQLDRQKDFAQAIDNFHKHKHLASLVALDHALNKVVLKNQEAISAKILLKLFRIKKSVARQIVALLSSEPIVWQKIPLNHLAISQKLPDQLLAFWQFLLKNIGHANFEQIQILKAPLNEDKCNIEIFITPRTASQNKQTESKEKVIEIYQEYSDTAEPDSSINQCITTALSDLSIGTFLFIPRENQVIPREALDQIKKSLPGHIAEIQKLCEDIKERSETNQNELSFIDHHERSKKPRSWFQRMRDGIEINIKHSQGGQLFFGKIILAHPQTVLQSDFYLRTSPGPESSPLT